MIWAMIGWPYNVERTSTRRLKIMMMKLEGRGKIGAFTRLLTKFLVVSLLHAHLLLLIQWLWKRMMVKSIMNDLMRQVGPVVYPVQVFLMLTVSVL